MADDLDAFFDDVQEVEAKAVEESKEAGKEEENDAALEPPPTKKMKVVAAAAPQRPRGVVVAASSSSKSCTTAEGVGTTLHSAPIVTKTSTIPPPPPPPPPPLPGPSIPVGPYIAPPPHQQDQQQRPTGTEHKKAHIRSAAGKTWVDPHLSDWPEGDFRLFCGNLGNEVTDQMLLDHFVQAGFKTCQRARVVRDNKTQNSKGYGFVSLQDALECARAIRQMDQSWLGSRPIKVKRSQWKDREWKNVQKTKKKAAKFEKKRGGSVY